MKTKQFVFKLQPIAGARTRIISIVTNDAKDVFGKGYELGFSKEDALALAGWARRARNGSKRKAPGLTRHGYELASLTVECRDPGPNWA